MWTSSGDEPARAVRNLAGCGTRTLAAVALIAACLQAHDLNQSESRLEVDGPVVRATTLVDLLEFPGVDADRDGRVSIAELDRSIAAVFATLKSHLTLASDGAAPLRVTLDRHELEASTPRPIDWAARASK